MNALQYLQLALIVLNAAYAAEKAAGNDIKILGSFTTAIGEVTQGIAAAQAAQAQVDASKLGPIDPIL